MEGEYYSRKRVNDLAFKLGGFKRRFEGIYVCKTLQGLIERTLPPHIK